MFLGTSAVETDEAVPVVVVGRASIEEWVELVLGHSATSLSQVLLRC